MTSLCLQIAGRGPRRRRSDEAVRNRPRTIYSPRARQGSTGPRAYRKRGVHGAGACHRPSVSAEPEQKI